MATCNKPEWKTQDTKSHSTTQRCWHTLQSGVVVEEMRGYWKGISACCKHREQVLAAKRGTAKCCKDVEIWLRFLGVEKRCGGISACRGAWKVCKGLSYGGYGKVWLYVWGLGLIGHSIGLSVVWEGTRCRRGGLEIVKLSKFWEEVCALRLFTALAMVWPFILKVDD